MEDAVEVHDREQGSRDDTDLVVEDHAVYGAGAACPQVEHGCAKQDGTIHDSGNCLVVGGDWQANSV
jgi:hypothetical protein